MYRAFMTDEIDLYRAAKLYIDQHGDQAALHRRPRRRRDVADDYKGDRGSTIDRTGWDDALKVTLRRQEISTPGLLSVLAIR